MSIGTPAGEEGVRPGRKVELCRKEGGRIEVEEGVDEEEARRFGLKNGCCRASSGETRSSGSYVSIRRTRS